MYTLVVTKFVVFLYTGLKNILIYVYEKCVLNIACIFDYTTIIRYIGKYAYRRHGFCALKPIFIVAKIMEGGVPNDSY